MVIYFDIVFLINFFMNFIILMLVAFVLNLDKNIYKILGGAALGCLFLLPILSPKFLFFEGLPAKIILSIAMNLISFCPCNLKDFIKILGFFYLVSFMVGGGTFALFYLFDLESAVSNSLLLLDNIHFPWWILPVSSAVLFLFFKYLWPYLYRVLLNDTLLVPISIICDDKAVNVSALIDTGNDLYDPLTEHPVIVVEFQAVKDFFDPKLQDIINKNQKEGVLKHIDFISNSNWACRFRLIPFESIGKSKGLMIGFKPDKVIVNFNDKVLEINNSIIGLHDRALSSNGSYKALLNPDVLSSK